MRSQAHADTRRLRHKAARLVAAALKLCSLPLNCRLQSLVCVGNENRHGQANPFLMIFAGMSQTQDISIGLSMIMVC